MAKKFTQLLDGTLTANDLFVISDSDGAVSNTRKITAEDVATFSFSTEQLNANITNLRNVLNGTDLALANNIKATQLFYNDGITAAYRDASYFLDWNNLRADTKPQIAENNSELENDMSFVSLAVGADDNFILKVRQTVGNSANARDITTDDIKQGSVNKYFDTATIGIEVRNSFGELFNDYSDTFDSGNTKSSLMNITGLFTADDSGVNSNRLTISSSYKTLQNGVTASDFAENQVLRVYGCNAGGQATITQVPSFTVSKNSFSDASANNNSQNFVKFEYRCAYFNLRSGEIGPRNSTIAGNQQVDLSLPGDASIDDIYDAFNTDYYVGLDFTGLEDGFGVLVYRRVGGSGTTMKLVAVLGPGDLGGNSWKDYYNFDYTSWSQKNAEDNSYIGGIDTDLVHFLPSIDMNPDTTAGGHAETFHGWSDLTIDTGGVSADLAAGTVTLTFKETVAINNIEGALGHRCNIAHNDTAKIAGAIADKISPEVGIRSLSLNAKTYNVTSLTIPNNFGLLGVLGITKLNKLPWSSFVSPSADSAPNPSIIKSQGIQGADTITLSSVDLDGNLLNQFLLDDSAGNTLVDFGVDTSDISIDNCRIQNMIGDGVKCSLPIRFKMNLSEISNSALTDRYEFTPLIIDSGVNTVVTGNVIQNFTASIDATVTTESILSNNVIKNVGAGLNLDNEASDTRPGIGLDIYGSTFVVSSSNVMMGPSFEALSTPDVLNSEFDSINILRSKLQNVGTGQVYNSDYFVYQENGRTLDLTEDSMGQNAKVVYRVNLLNVDSDNNHTIYGNRLGPGVKDINNQEFTATTTGGLANPGSKLQIGKPYEILRVGNTEWTDLGAFVNKAGATFLWNGTSLPAYNASSGFVTAKEFPGFVDGNGVSHDFIELTNSDPNGDPDLDATDGQFKFEITNSAGSALEKIISGVYSPAQLKALYNSGLSSGIHTSGTKHYGMAWTANLVRNVDAGRLTGPGSWASPAQLTSQGLDANGLNVYGKGQNDPSNADLWYVDYSVEVDGLKYVDVGDMVRLNPTGSWNAGTANGVNLYDVSTNPYNGFVVENTPGSSDNLRSLKIRFYGGTTTHEPTGQQVSTGNAPYGTLNIVDDFVMAQGLIK